MDRGQPEALEVLRDVWRGQSQDAADLDGGETGGCKRMAEAGVGYDDFGGDDFGGATEEERRSSWRARLEREGKLNPGARGLRDIVLQARDGR